MRSILGTFAAKNNLTQQDSANKLGVSLSYYNSIENGNRQKNMDLRFASKIAETFHVPIDFIVAEESKLAESA